ncbi:uncharacterized protein LOC142606004 [Castanea sativa]|uniref:uncharacterized protein LOC142606004 n=1 Tax=Castanea sativa TaxID=21020 RepID=UPI003F64F215
MVYGVLDYLFEYQEGVYEVSKASPSLPARLSPPPLDRYKINVDGAVFASQKFMGIGVLIRDLEGRLVGACSKKIQAPLGLVEVEAKAVEFGLLFAKDMMIRDFILEGDSLVLMNALKEISPPPSSIAAVVYGSLLSSHDFRQVEFFHVCWQGNRPAHLLAKHSLSINDFSVWIEESPCFLEQALLNDVLFLL